jgi:hypothetical protein
MISKGAFCVNVHHECRDIRYDIDASSVFHGNHTGVLSLIIALNGSQYSNNVYEIFDIFLEANVTGISKYIKLNACHCFCWGLFKCPAGTCERGRSFNFCLQTETADQRLAVHGQPTTCNGILMKVRLKQGYIQLESIGLTSLYKLVSILYM